MWRLLVLLLWFSLAVTVRRLLRGPRRPRWTWLLETIQPVLLGIARWGMRLGIAKIRRRIGWAARLVPRLPGVTTVPEQAGSVQGEWFRPLDREPDLTVLYLHGGGYVCCSVETHRCLVTRIARALQAAVLAINYRLAPEHPYPAGLDDAEEAYRWLLARGVRPERLVIAGDSAGGGLVLALLLRLRDKGIMLPACGYCLSPWTDLAGTGDSMTENPGFDYLPVDGIRAMAAQYLGPVDPHTPWASPLYGDFTGLPALLIQVGSAEVLLDDSRRVEQRARAARVQVQLEVWEDMVHVFQAFDSIIPQSAQAIEHAALFIRTHTDQNKGSVVPPAKVQGLQSVGPVVTSR